MVAALALGFFGLMTAFSQSNQEPIKVVETNIPKQQIVISLKHYTDDLHAAFMALKIGNGLLSHGAQVTLFVNLEGVRIVDKGTPDDLKWGLSEATPDQLLTEFVKGGGTVFVCPHCAHAAGITPDQLRDGAAIIDQDAVTEMFLQADKVIDY